MRFLTSCVFLSISTEPCKSSIYPFQELKRPLQFLGLYDTTLCNVTHIPAYKVPEPGFLSADHTRLNCRLIPSIALYSGFVLLVKSLCFWTFSGDWIKEWRPGPERHRGLHRVSPWARPQSHQSAVWHCQDTTLQPAAPRSAGRT